MILLQCSNDMVDRWYRVNYAVADTYHWGRHLGCDFVTKSCMEWMSLRRQRFGHLLPVTFTRRSQWSSGSMPDCSTRGPGALHDLFIY